MAEPVTLAEAKRQVRMVDDDSEDTFLETDLIPAVRAYVERVAGLSFVAGTKTASFSRWGDYLELFRRPIASITSVFYGSTGTETEYTGFQANLSGYPVRIYAATDDVFPELSDGETIIVTYATGALADTSEEYLIGKRAMLLLLGFWFENRGEAPLTKEQQLAFDSVLDDLRPVSAY